MTHELPVATLIGMSDGAGSLTREEALERHRERLRRQGKLPPQ